MELKEGMYVRTDKGLIDKILLVEYAKERQEKYPNHPSKSYWRDKYFLSKKGYWQTSRGIIKASFNIIDLIEVGDIIKFKELRTHFINNSSTKFYEKYIYDVHNKDELKKIKEEIGNNKIELLEILTKEQFEREAFKL